ncbi:MAG: hypothetical protein OXT69_05945 [Candidatus Poribacteria bacterium]|nr:hypothetical protein [Candidatus Poribacteria bacterium]
MRKLLILTALMSMAAGAANAQLPFEVKTIYFKPTDVPENTAKVKRLIEGAQELYQSEMERHGFGAKTFRLDPTIHIIRGQNNLAHYKENTYNKIEQELPQKFRNQNNVYAIFLAGADFVEGWPCGVGWPIFGWANGGTALIAEHSNCPDHVSLTAHELGHAFGLYHDLTNPKAIMGAGDDEFNDFECRWLDKHHYFNDVHRINDVPDVFEVQMKGVKLDGKKYAQFTIDAGSDIGLHQAHLMRLSDVGVVGWDTTIQGARDSAVIQTRTAWLAGDASLVAQILDIQGNHFMHTFPYMPPTTFEGDEEEEPPMDVSSGGKLPIVWADLKK